MKKHNFNAGPSILPSEVIENTAKAILDFNGSGLSLMEISHRAKDFQPVVDEAVSLFKELLNIPEGYSVIFLGGGASLEFCMVPYNFLEKKAAYLNTGAWAKKAMKEAKGFGEVVEVASSAEANYTYIPKGYTIPTDADYFHITSNNTIYGTEILKDLDSPVPMIADMSSDILSRPVDVSKYICIYGGAQKNLAPAGVTFVIVKDDALGKVSRYIPTMLNYQTHIDNGSMFNTPPVVPIYAATQTLRWIKEQGGVKEMERRLSVRDLHWLHLVELKEVSVVGCGVVGLRVRMRPQHQLSFGSVQVQAAMKNLQSKAVIQRGAGVQLQDGTVGASRGVRPLG